MPDNFDLRSLFVLGRIRCSQIIILHDELFFIKFQRLESVLPEIGLLKQLLLMHHVVLHGLLLQQLHLALQQLDVFVPLLGGRLLGRNNTALFLAAFRGKVPFNVVVIYLTHFLSNKLNI